MQVEIKQHSPFGDKLKIRRWAFLPCLKARGFQPEDFDEEIKEWYEEKQLRPYIRVTIDKLDQNKVKVLIPIMVDPKTGESGGDPWVIALAQDLQNGIVVTQEKASRNEDKPKIPNICKGLDIECINLLDVIKKEEWKF